MCDTAPRGFLEAFQSVSTGAAGADGAIVRDEGQERLAPSAG